MSELKTLVDPLELCREIASRLADPKRCEAIELIEVHEARFEEIEAVNRELDLVASENKQKNWAALPQRIL